MREGEALRQLNHPNIVRMVAAAGAEHEGQLQQAQELDEASLERGREPGDRSLVMLALGDLAVNSLLRGDWAQLRRYAEERPALRRETGDKVFRWEVHNAKLARASQWRSASLVT